MQKVRKYKTGNGKIEYKHFGRDVKTMGTNFFLPIIKESHSQE